MNWIAYQVRRWWIRRSIAICQYRLQELERIVERERHAILFHELRLNARLRDLETRQHFERLARGLQ